MIDASHIRVIIVDDENMMRTLMRHRLKRIGFTQIFEAANPVEALPVARANRVDLIISDYNMPVMNGLDFLQSVRRDSLLDSAAFIMVSGSGDDGVVRKSVEFGANGYLMKPLSMIDLRERLEGIFGKFTSMCARSYEAA